MFRTLFSVLILLSGAVSLTVPQVWAAETTQSKKEKKKQSAKEKREAAKAKREAAKAKKAEEKAQLEEEAKFITGFIMHQKFI